MVKFGDREIAKERAERKGYKNFDNTVISNLVKAKTNSN